MPLGGEARWIWPKHIKTSKNNVKREVQKKFFLLQLYEKWLWADKACWTVLWFTLSSFCSTLSIWHSIRNNVSIHSNLETSFKIRNKLSFVSKIILHVWTGTSCPSRCRIFIIFKRLLILAMFLNGVILLALILKTEACTKQWKNPIKHSPQCKYLIPFLSLCY